jgi:fructokinase
MKHKSLMHIFGEVLFDHFPDGSRVPGGAPFNVAWHLQAFEQNPRFISRIGGDPPGHEITALMDAWGMSREALQSDSEHPTGSVRVHIENGEPHYEIVAACAYDFTADESPDREPTEGILYHGTLALRNKVARATLQALKTRHRGKIFVDVNLRAPWWERETVSKVLGDADWVKLNEAELAALCPERSALEAAMRAFCDRFELEGLVVTRGEKGAVACDGRQHFTGVEPSAAAIPLVDSVGAGDAFAAVLLLGISRQWPLAETLERAQAFASALVGRRGATVADREFYRPFNERWRLADG